MTSQLSPSHSFPAGQQAPPLQNNGLAHSELQTQLSPSIPVASTHPCASFLEDCGQHPPVVHEQSAVEFWQFSPKGAATLQYPSPTFGTHLFCAGSKYSPGGQHLLLPKKVSQTNPGAHWHCCVQSRPSWIMSAIFTHPFGWIEMPGQIPLHVCKFSSQVQS